MRKLLISTENLRFVAGCKDKIDALAFAVFIKETYVNSQVTNATQRKMKSLFGMGADKLKKVVSDGIKYGFLRREGSSLIANKLHGKRELSYMLRSLFFNMAKKRKGRLTLTAVRHIIETAIICNQVSMQNNCTDTHNRVTDGRSVNVIRCAKRRESRMLRHTCYDERYRGLSNIRIQQLLGRKRGTAVKRVKEAISHRLLSKRIRISGVDMMGDPCNVVTYHSLKDTNIIVCVRMRSAFVRFSNEYKYLQRDIKKANHGK